MLELPEWATRVCEILLRLLPILLWIAFWLFAVNWRKTWPVLAQGAWVGVVLLVLLVSMVWSHIDDSPWQIPGMGSAPSGWACLGCVSAWTLLALFCGWLQGVLNVAPAEIELEPAEEHPEPHGHAHG